MSVQRACDICKFYRQRLDGSPGVLRYGLFRQFYIREGGQKRRNFQRSRGSIDLCDECWERIAGPRMKTLKPRPTTNMTALERVER